MSAEGRAEVAANHNSAPCPQMTHQLPHLNMYGLANTTTTQHSHFTHPQLSSYTQPGTMNYHSQHHTQQDLDNNNDTRLPKAKEMSLRPPLQRTEPRRITKGIANSILLAPIIKNVTIDCNAPGVVLDPRRLKDPHPLSDRSNKGSPRTRIAIATDSVLGPAKKHIAKVFLKHGVTGSFSPNLDKLVEITGNMGTLFQSYKDYCTKRHLKTVNKETYARLFRNEFKRKVGAR